MLSSAVIECISDISSLCMFVMITQFLRVVNIWYEKLYADTRYCICDIGIAYEYGIHFFNIMEILLNYF